MFRTASGSMFMKPDSCPDATGCAFALDAAAFLQEGNEGSLVQYAGRAAAVMLRDPSMLPSAVRSSPAVRPASAMRERGIFI